MRSSFLQALRKRKAIEATRNAAGEFPVYPSSPGSEAEGIFTTGGGDSGVPGLLVDMLLLALGALIGGGMG